MNFNFRLGDGMFETPDRGGRLGFDLGKSKNIRWTYNQELNVAITALAGGAGATIALPIASNEKIITLQDIYCTCVFEDSGAGSYNVSEFVNFTFVTASIANSDANGVYNFPSAKYSFNPLNLMVQVTAASTIEITVFINGGDILRATGITPGAGDTLDFDLQASYF